MKLRVPFYKQKTDSDCGPAALKMVLDYFGENKKLTDIYKLMDKKEGKGISTIQIAEAASKLGHKAIFYSTYVLLNEENLKLDFYKKYSNLDLEYSKQLIKNAKKSGVKIHEKTLLLKEILRLVTRDSIPIILLDWNIINNKNGYQGHFVPIVGYDANNIYVHKPNGKKFLRIEKKMFDKARKAEGTDEDIAIIQRRL